MPSAVAAPVSSSSSPIARTASDLGAPLTNKDVVDLSKVGLAPDALVVKIKTSNCSFDTSPTAFRDLKSEQIWKNCCGTIPRNC